jgi:hypothetical protein
VTRDELPQKEQEFVLDAGPLERASLRADVLAFCQRNQLSCEVSERRRRALSVRMSFRVRGADDAIASLAGYLRWTGRSFRTGPPRPDG